MPGIKQKELFDLFSDEEYKVLVKKLFSSDEPAFRGTIIEISLLQSWKQIAPYLDKLFLANKIDPFSAEAVLLTDKLFAHFNLPGTGE